MSTKKTNESTVLIDGTVEGRGHGSSLAIDDIHEDIKRFLQSNRWYNLSAELRSFFTLWIFLTRLPAPDFLRIDLHAGYLMRGMAYMAMIGCVIGGWASLWLDGMIALGLPLSAASTIATASTLWLTGCFHEDGVSAASAIAWMPASTVICLTLLGCFCSGSWQILAMALEVDGPLLKSYESCKIPGLEHMEQVFSSFI